MLRMTTEQTMSNSYKIGLAGCGKMGAAMVQAWLAGGLVKHIDILDPNGLPDSLGGNSRIAHFESEESFTRNAHDWDVMVLAIKPQIMGEFSDRVQGKLPNDLGILSIAAGQSLSSLQDKFGKDQPIIRSMPNTPAAIGKGITVACPGKNAPETLAQAAHDLLSALGMVEWTHDESVLDAVTAVSGSGPAYLFYLIEALAEAGFQAGLDKDFAMKLARQTVIGAGALAEGDADTPAFRLRENVTSPKGTTDAALSVLMDGRFQSLMNEAVAKATARSKELSK